MTIPHVMLVSRSLRHHAHGKLFFFNFFIFPFLLYFPFLIFLMSSNTLSGTLTIRGWNLLCLLIMNTLMMIISSHRAPTKCLVYPWFSPYPLINVFFFLRSEKSWEACFQVDWVVLISLYESFEFVSKVNYPSLTLFVLNGASLLFDFFLY